MSRERIMTPDEIDAGREMDAMIAERVMGWIWWRSIGGFSDGRRGLFPPEATKVGDDGTWCRADGTEEPFEGRVGLILEYSTDIAAAWLVVEKLKDGCPVGVGFSARLMYWPPDPPDERWLVEFGCNNWPGKGERIVVGEGPTLPLAICRAALKTVGIEKE